MLVRRVVESQLRGSDIFDDSVDGQSLLVVPPPVPVPAGLTLA
jgi:hypothetical protein